MFKAIHEKMPLSQFSLYQKTYNCMFLNHRWEIYIYTKGAVFDIKGQTKVCFVSQSLFTIFMPDMVTFNSTWEISFNIDRTPNMHRHPKLDWQVSHD